MREERAMFPTWGKCPACNYPNAPGEVRCEKCGRKFAGPQRPATRGSNVYPLQNPAGVQPRIHPVRPASAQAHAAPSPGPMAEATRSQIRGRVHAFRARRLNGNLPLQFEPSQAVWHEELPPAGTAAVEQAPNAATAAPELPVTIPQPPPPPRWPRHTPPRVTQPELNFPAMDMPEESSLALPVAPFRLRLMAHAADFGLSLAAFLVFLIPFRVLVGSVVPTRFTLAGMGCAYLLLAFLYGLVFLCWAGATPAMKWMGLRVVDFNGTPPPRQQLFYRWLGAMASVGSFFLGFLLAAVDEEKLSWHDRISKTFLTASQP